MDDEDEDDEEDEEGEEEGPFAGDTIHFFRVLCLWRCDRVARQRKEEGRDVKENHSRLQSPFSFLFLLRI